MNVFEKFFTREGGVSEGIYEGLNCGPGSNDDPAAVEENLRRACAELGCDEDRLLLLHQIHSSTCLVAQDTWTTSERPQADAMVTDQHALAIGVLTADCTPVLFKGTKSDGTPVIGAAHAGWKGALGGVLDNTVKAMEELGGTEIEAMVGPCISQVSYEVQEQFAEPFLDEVRIPLFLPPPDLARSGNRLRRPHPRRAQSRRLCFLRPRYDVAS